MSYERQNSMSRLEQYRARQAERIEAMSRAIDEGRTTVVSSGASAEETPRRRVHLSTDRPVKQIPAKPFRVDLNIKHLDTGAWVGSRKSVAATSVESSFRQPIKVTVAAPIRQIGSQAGLRDGQLFSYDAGSGQMIPVEVEMQRTAETQRMIVKRTGGIIKRSRRARPQHHVMGNVALKVK